MRVRFEFSKIGKIRFTSHRDVARIWERGLRRAGIPLTYSEGFSPRPKLAFGLALPTTYESVAEYIDVALGAEATSLAADLNELCTRISVMLPAGMDVTGAVAVDRGRPSLQQAVTSCRWEITSRGTDIGVITAWIDEVLRAPSIVVTRQRKGKSVTDDLRPSVLDLSLLGEDELGVRFAAELGTQPRALRPSELLNALDRKLPGDPVRRTNQWILLDGSRCEPLEAAGAPAAHAEVYA